METRRPHVRTITVRCAPAEAPCPDCGQLGPRKAIHNRLVRTIAYKQVAFLDVTYGEYRARCSCRNTFRTNPPDVEPKALYDDELHLGRMTLLLATDPLQDLPVSFALVARNDSDHMRRFLKNLKAWGISPEVVVTDGSNLYPAILAELWPQARHQLCVFDVLKELHKHVLDALRRLRRGLSRRGNRGRKRKPGRRPQARVQRPGLTNKEKSAFVFKHRWRRRSWPNAGLLRGCWLSIAPQAA